MLEAFRELCVSLCHSVCFCVPRVNDLFILECDASSTGVGAVLSVKREEDVLPIAFLLRATSICSYIVVKHVTVRRNWRGWRCMRPSSISGIICMGGDSW